MIERERERKRQRRNVQMITVEKEHGSQKEGPHSGL